MAEERGTFDIREILSVAGASRKGRRVEEPSMDDYNDDDAHHQ